MSARAVRAIRAVRAHVTESPQKRKQKKDNKKHGETKKKQCYFCCLFGYLRKTQLCEPYK